MTLLLQPARVVLRLVAAARPRNVSADVRWVATVLLRGIPVTNQIAEREPAQHLGGPNPCDEKSICGD